ncbi:hypothetical protein [uncultured Gammaproteobacteria bacterium]|nr:hypothetical protein [uncultured Gammaproteobacteria bacterium]
MKKTQLTHFFKSTFSKTSTPAPITNIAGEVLSSALNKLKHFLVFGLLTALSLNALSADKPQPFNKAAYLDLSKPYTHKQSNTTKKDNQATALLKEVAGTARTALGSTNSDNTGQLGNKITKGVSNQLKNKAINKTEGFVNNKANTFLNAFGAGRSEVSIGGLSSKKLNYSLKTIQPISELDANSKALTFIQASIASGKSIDSRRITVNLGVGHRLLVENDMAIAGVNLFTDYETQSKHKRLSLGLEYQRSNFSANINKYHPLSDKKTVNGVEEALAGYDVKLSGQAPYLPWAKIKGTYYHWDAKAGANIKGNILGVEIELTPSVSFEIGQENNNTMNATSYGRLTVKLPLGDKQKITNFKISDKVFKASSKVDLGEFAWVERTNKIMIEKENSAGGISAFTGGLFRGLTYALVTSPNTGRVWLDRNLGATQVATSGTDSAAYGDLYQWGRATDGHESRTSGTTTTMATTITPGTNTFVTTNATPYDWTTADSTGSSRTSAWINAGTNDICPAGFSVPTETELKADTINATTAITNSATAFSSFLKIPGAGYRYRANGALNTISTIASLWSRSAGGTDGRHFFVDSGNAHFDSDDRAKGSSVRCIMD